MADQNLSAQDAADRAASQALRDELAGIESRIDGGAATSADLARAVKLIMKYLGLATTP